MSTGTYNIAEAQGVKEGTKVIIHLKESCSEFADYDKVRDIIKKYSSFVGSQLYLNNEKANELRPLWLMDPKSVDAEQHEDFYRYTVLENYEKCKTRQNSFHEKNSKIQKTEKFVKRRRLCIAISQEKLLKFKTQNYS